MIILRKKFKKVFKKCSKIVKFLKFSSLKFRQKYNFQLFYIFSFGNSPQNVYLLNAENRMTKLCFTSSEFAISLISAEKTANCARTDHMIAIWTTDSDSERKIDLESIFKYAGNKNHLFLLSSVIWPSWHPPNTMWMQTSGRAQLCTPCHHDITLIPFQVLYTYQQCSSARRWLLQ